MTNNIDKIVNDCPANNDGKCFINDDDCNYQNKTKCRDYINHIPKSQKQYGDKK